MNKKKILLIIVVLIILVVLAAFAVSKFNTDFLGNNDLISDDDNNNESNDKVTKTANDNETLEKITAVQSGPDSAKAGDKVSLKWTVINYGSKDIENVVGKSQTGSVEFGTIKAGQTKTITVTLDIPSKEALKEDFGPDAKFTNPLYVGGFSLEFEKDGSSLSETSNPIEIMLTNI